MACRKYTLTNTTSSNGVFSYQECSNQMWNYDILIQPNTILNVWLITGTFSTATSSIITVDDLGNFPFVVPPTPSVSGTGNLTPTPTPTPSITPSISPTSETPTPTPSPSGTPAETPSGTPAETPSGTPAETPSETPAETPTPTPSLTPTTTLTATPTTTLTATPTTTLTATPTTTLTATPTTTLTATPTTTLTATQTPTPSPTSAITPSEFTVTVTEVGSDVVFSGGGSFDLTSLSFSGTNDFTSGFNNSNALFGVGPITPTSVDLYSGVTFTTYPTDFGSGTGIVPNSGSGDLFGIFSQSLPTRLVAVPTGYISGTNISGTTTYTNTTISSLNMTSGTYTYDWGSGSLILIIN